MGRLSGKVAIITGAGQGIGQGIAKAFAKEGANLVITGRVAEKLDRVTQELGGIGAKVASFVGDAGIKANAEQAVKTAIDTFGRLDVVVNNALATNPGIMVEDLSDEELDLTFGSGFRATLYHMQAAFPCFKEHGGSIINFGTKVGIQPMPGIAAYAATKEAIRALTRVAAKEWGRYQIRVNVINPASLSPGMAAYFEANPEDEAFHLKDVALGYFGDAEKDIGGVAIFLATDDSRYVTGQTINVDGGQVML